MFYTISTIFAIITNLILGLLVLLNNKRRAVNTSFFLLSLFIALWLGSNYYIDLIKNNAGLALFLLKVINIVGVWVFFFLLFFSFSFLKIKTLFIKIYVIMPILSSLLLMTNLIIKDVDFQGWGYMPILGELAPLVLLYEIGTAILAIVLLITKYKGSVGLFKQRLKYVLWGIALTFFFALLFSTFIPLLIKESEIVKLSSLSTVFLVGFIAYAIVKHRLMDIRLLVLKSVSYTIFAGLIVGGYVLSTVLIFNKLESFISPIAINVITLLILMATYNPIRHFIENSTDRIFAKGQYKPAELLKELEVISNKYAKKEDLAKNWIDIIANQMRITKVAFISTGSPSVVDIQQINFDNMSKDKWQKLVTFLYESKETIVRDEIEEDNNNKDLLETLGIEILLPVKLGSEMVGMLALGEKRSGDTFYGQDIQILERFIGGVAVTALARSKETEKVATFYHQAQIIISNPNLNDVLNATIDDAFSKTGSEGGSIMLFDDKNQTLSVAASRGLPHKFHERKVKLGEGIAGLVAKERKALIIHNDDKKMKKFLNRPIVSSMCVPLEAGDTLVGVLSINRAKNKERFAIEDKELVSTLAANIAQRIQNAKLVEEERKRNKEVLNIFAAAVEIRDPYTYGHSEAVTRYSVAIAKEMGFDKESILQVETAGLLHDIGKIGISDSILKKEGPLTDEEYEIIKDHPRMGLMLIQQYSNLEKIGPIAFQHHERYDGRGYPNKLPGDKMLEEARILAVADAFDAMTSDRPYRPGMPLEKAKAIIQEESGKQFDPEVVNAFVKIVDKFYKTEKQRKNKFKIVDVVKSHLKLVKDG